MLIAHVTVVPFLCLTCNGRLSMGEVFIATAMFLLSVVGLVVNKENT